MTGKTALHMKLTKEKDNERHCSKEDTTDSEGHGERTPGTKLRKGHTHWGPTPRVLRSSDE